jgi:hypothetical protein
MNDVLGQQASLRQDKEVDCIARNEFKFGATKDLAPLNENLRVPIRAQTDINELRKLQGWNSYHGIALQGHMHPQISNSTSEQQLLGN